MSASPGWEVVIGLEVHCQLKTLTKLFCACANRFGAAPNSQICPVCTGQPGALPVTNRAAFTLALRAGLALGCDIDRRSRFDRKNYFYCDLPKGYQITQYERPLLSGGEVVLSDGKRVRLTRIHLEEDAGKAIHDRGDVTLVDLNRAGVPLIEIVSEPELSSATEAQDYLETLREILVFADASDCDMEKGSLRCDVNVSVRRPGQPLGTRIELKNLNSFRFVGEAIEHEVGRQTKELEAGVAIRQETRLYDPQARETRTMRSKEDEADYRYFPDPDLPPVEVTEEWIESVRAELPEAAGARRRRYIHAWSLSEYDAGVLTGSRELADFFEQTVGLGSSPAEVAKWLANDVLRALGEADIPGDTLAELALSPTALHTILELLEAGRVHRNGARTLLRHLLVNGGEPEVLVGELGLEQVRDDGALESWCEAVLRENETAVAAVRDGKEKALGSLVGAVMKASQGKADPRRVRELLQQRISAGS